MEDSDEARMGSLIEERSLGEILWADPNCIILSLFPHQSNPRIPAMLFKAFGEMGIAVEGAANSPSALSLILHRGLLGKVGTPAL